MMSQAAFSLGAIPAGKGSAAFSAARIGRKHIFYQTNIFYRSTPCGSRAVEVEEEVEAFLGYMRKGEKKPPDAPPG